MAPAHRRITPLATVVVAASAWPVSRPRNLQDSSTCNAVALRLLPPPSLSAYTECFNSKLRSNNTHDWDVPGAEIAADVECWCMYNMTGTFEQYDCCEHAEVYPMCTVDCRADCSSSLAQQCITECPSMCFEAAEYVVDRSLCTNCNWVKCWPVIQCMTNHAEQRVETGDLEKTCAEDDFMKAGELAEYWDCWKHAPKHSSHWNVLSSVVHCICRESMINMVNRTACCSSVLYGGGSCDLKCLDESECSGQKAQTCIHSCQMKCPAFEMTPNDKCTKECLDIESECRQYSSCRPPSVASHICDDGRWPESSSGCCAQDDGGFGCPRMCETQKVWRLDRRNGLPWWTRWGGRNGLIAQCTCDGCPSSTKDAYNKLEKTVAGSLWDNGQVILVDIARRAGLQLGPNRRMQELMVERNRKILSTLERSGENETKQASVDAIHQAYVAQIERAALDYPDDGESGNIYPTRSRRKGDGSRNHTPVVVTIIVCTVVVLIAVAAAAFGVIWWKKQHDKVVEFAAQQGGTVVFGNPVQDSQAMVGHIQVGAPVTVQAPTKCSPSGGFPTAFSASKLSE